ncbi:hypothetical protein SSIL_1414 [Solibacillus silvestris StLB046]|uniref:Uncharacterized protein n=1 Tax=Solibacillus silvestris (strain StLB046) TaxID=1002809 RepID=F2F2J9_SOLSS|nr:hypothetical protein [Solibacillus silvestris]BAK15837.1 hypothetical protein SSIL_1414 [Solibacillus silvestris StLB046]
MLNIQVTDDYKLTSDGMQIIVQKRHIIDPTKSPKFKEGQSTEKYEDFRTWKYCGKVEQAIELIIQQKIFESDAANLKELKREITDFKEYVKNILH